MKKLLLLLISIIYLVFLTACWDYKEIEEVALVSAIAIDIDDNTGQYIVNVEIVDVEEGPSGPLFTPSLIEIRGETIYDAIRNMISLTTKKLYFAHTPLLVVSQEYAKEGLIPILDWLSRHQEPRLTISIYVSKEDTAKEVLLLESSNTKMRTFEFEEILKADKYLAKSPNIQVFQVTNQVQNNKIGSVLPLAEIVNINGKDSIKLQGSAYFSTDKLKGVFDPMETMKYLFVKDQIDQGVLVIDMQEKDNMDKVTLEIFNNKSKINIKIENQDIFFIVKINTLVSIQEIDSGINYTDKNGRAFLKKKTEDFIEKEIGSFIASVQENAIDIFGFGNLLSKKHPDLWKTIEEDWDTIFKDLNIDVVSTVRILNSGHISSPITVGE